MSETELVQFDRADGSRVVRLTVTERGMRDMNREQLQMLQDALFLMESALRGETDGPLTLPRTGLPVRV